MNPHNAYDLIAFMAMLIAGLWLAWFIVKATDV